MHINIIDALLGEHGVLYAQFAECERTLEQCDLAGLQQIANVLARGIATHAELEDRLLFDDAERQNGSEIYELMHHDHVTIERSLHEIQQTRDPEHARQLLLDAIYAAREHFLKEERVAFPMVAEQLSEAELRRLGQAWASERGIRV